MFHSNLAIATRKVGISPAWFEILKETTREVGMKNVHIPFCEIHNMDRVRNKSSSGKLKGFYCKKCKSENSSKLYKLKNSEKIEQNKIDKHNSKLQLLNRGIYKICKNHGELKIDQVYIYGNVSECKKCKINSASKNKEKYKQRSSEYTKKDRKLNPEKYRNRQKKYQQKYRSLITEKTICRRLNIPIETYRKMFIDQNNKCYICKKEETKVSAKSGKINKLSLDHCHKTNKIRKLLCHNCNILIGSAKDSVEILQEAINYLKEFNYDKTGK